MSTSVLSRIRRFLWDSYRELLQCVWPNRSQLFESTMLVVVVIVVLAFFVYVVDVAGGYVIQGITTGDWGR